MFPDLAGSEVLALKKALQDARLELDIILKAYHQDFDIDESEMRTLDRHLQANKSPDEMIFDKMMESPYLPTVGLKNTPDVTGKVVEVKADKAKKLAIADRTSNVIFLLSDSIASSLHPRFHPAYLLARVIVGTSWCAVLSRYHSPSLQSGRRGRS